jgi:hypothetical protein
LKSGGSGIITVNHLPHEFESFQAFQGRLGTPVGAVFHIATLERRNRQHGPIKAWKLIIHGVILTHGLTTSTLGAKRIRRVFAEAVGYFRKCSRGINRQAAKGAKKAGERVLLSPAGMAHLRSPVPGR